MKNSNFTKFLIVVFTFSVIVWLGGSVLRAVIAYSLFVPATELELKPDQSDELRMNTIKIYSDTAIYTTVSFALVFILSIFFIIYYRKHLKVYGWLFMAFVLFFIASPIEIYLTLLDIKLMIYVNYSQTIAFTDPEVAEFFLNRLKNFNVLSPLAYLSFFTAIIFLIYRPLDKSRKNLSE